MSLEMSFKEVLAKRKSVKEFDPTVKISHEEMEEMIQYATTAPSSCNMQPWRFVIIDTDETKEKIKDLVQFNTRQLNTSSAFIFVLGDVDHLKTLDPIYQKSVDLGYMPQEVKDQTVGFLSQGLNLKEREYFLYNAMMDANLAAMQFMLVATSYGYDTNPIGGFERKEVMEVLDIDTERYFPVMMIAIGKGVKPPYNSSRHEVSEVISYNKGNNGQVGTI